MRTFIEKQPHEILLEVQRRVSSSFRWPKRTKVTTRELERGARVEWRFDLPGHRTLIVEFSQAELEEAALGDREHVINRVVHALQQRYSN